MHLKKSVKYGGPSEVSNSAAASSSGEGWSSEAWVSSSISCKLKPFGNVSSMEGRKERRWESTALHLLFLEMSYARSQSRHRLRLHPVEAGRTCLA